MQTRFFIFLLLFSASSSHIFAQEGYKPAYVVFTNGTTDTGTMRYADWERTPAKVSFINKTGVEKEFTPQNLLSFTVNREQYISATVQIDKRPVNGSNAGELMEDSIRTENVFLKVLVKGTPFTLYQYSDSRYHYYLETSPGNINELMYNGIYERYKLQLSEAILASQPGKYNAEQLTRLNYTEEEISKFISRQNNRSEYDINIAVKKKRVVHFSAGAGLTYETLKFESSERHFGKLDFTNSTSLALAAGADILLGKNNPRLALRFELVYATFNTKGVTIVPSSITGRNDRVEYEIRQVNIRPYAGMVYNIVNDELFKLYMGAGLGINISSYPVNKYITYDLVTGNAENLGYQMELQSNWPAGYLQVGAILKNRFEFRASGRIFGTIENKVKTTENGVRLMGLFMYRF